eukprot:10319080-Lingulodinium_polyedra.AAC.1
MCRLRLRRVTASASINFGHGHVCRQYFSLRAGAGADSTCPVRVIYHAMQYSARGAAQYST